jgi:hypothetical protein
MSTIFGCFLLFRMRAWFGVLKSTEVVVGLSPYFLSPWSLDRGPFRGTSIRPKPAIGRMSSI